MHDEYQPYGANPQQPQSPYHQYQAPPPPIYGAMPEPDKRRGLAIAGMALGIASIPAALIALCGVAIAVPGLVLSIMGRKSQSARGMALAGIICSSIGLTLAVANGILGFILVATGRYPGMNP